jgi:hypothetical protein
VAVAETINEAAALMEDHADQRRVVTPPAITIPGTSSASVVLLWDEVVHVVRLAPDPTQENDVPCSR